MVTITTTSIANNKTIMAPPGNYRCQLAMGATSIDTIEDGDGSDADWPLFALETMGRWWRRKTRREDRRIAT